MCTHIQPERKLQNFHQKNYWTDFQFVLTSSVTTMRSYAKLQYFVYFFYARIYRFGCIAKKNLTKVSSPMNTEIGIVVLSQAHISAICLVSSLLHPSFFSHLHKLICHRAPENKNKVIFKVRQQPEIWQRKGEITLC